MDNEAIFWRMLIVHYMHYRAAVLQNDGYHINLQYGFTNNMKRVLKVRFGRTDDEIQDVIAVMEEVIDTAIKNGRPNDQPRPLRAT